MTLLTKPVDEICVEDVERLAKSRVPEGEQVEFKEGLPDGKHQTDRWINAGTISDRARNLILEEVVAFANAYGGALVLGIEESKDKPSVAQRVTPIERCADLAERLKLVFRDCVEPELPSIEIVAILTTGDAGVVVVRTAASRLAPHRVMPTRRCTVRRADRCEELTMREIQDLTINVARGLEKLDESLSDRAELFGRQFDVLADPANAFGLRITAAPVGEDLRIGRVVLQGSIDPRFAPPTITVSRIHRYGEDASNRLFGFGKEYSMVPRDWRPRLRAVRAEATDYLPDRIGVDRKAYLEVHCDGLVELAFVFQREHVISDGRGIPMPMVDSVPVFEFARICMWANEVRRSADAPGSEYAIQPEICVRGGDVSIHRADDLLSAYRGYELKIPPPGIHFPRYSLGPASEIDTLCGLFERDFWNAMGTDFAPNQGSICVSAAGPN